MGGAVFEFPITPSTQMLERARRQKRTLLSRLLGGRDSTHAPEAHLSPLVRPIQKHLIEDFRHWLSRVVPRPWEATESVQKSYLMLVRAEDISFARRTEGEHRGQWVACCRLSGCAGMAECSSWLVSHWLVTWFRGERERIGRELLGPAGVQIGQGEPEGMITDETFLPIGPYGYAMFHPGLVDADEPEDGEFGPFELDGAIGEADPVVADALRRFLRSRFTGLMRDGRCRCQICMPEFDLTILAGLTV